MESGHYFTQSGHHLMLKERQQRLIHRDYIGTTQGLLDTKPTPETARMPVRVQGWRSQHGTSLCRDAPCQLSQASWLFLVYPGAPA